MMHLHSHRLLRDNSEREHLAGVVRRPSAEDSLPHAHEHEPTAQIASHSYGKMRFTADVPILTKEVLMGNVQKVKSCVERYGQDVNRAGSDGTRPLHVAAEIGHIELCTYLVGQKADIFARSNNGLCPLHMAARGGHVAILKMFRASEGFYQGDLDIRTLDQWSCLHFACRDARKDVFDFLVKETTRTAAIMDVDLDAKTHDGRTPLLIAAHRGDLEMVTTLIDYGANSAAICPSEIYGYSGLGALHLACMGGHKAVVKFLALNGEDLDVKTKGGWTPLMMAAHAGYTDIVEMLVSAGADVRAQTTNSPGESAWTLAQRKGHLEIIKILEQETEILDREAAARQPVQDRSFLLRRR